MAKMVFLFNFYKLVRLLEITNDCIDFILKERTLKRMQVVCVEGEKLDQVSSA